MRRGTRKKKREWNGNVQDLNKYKLSRKELLRRKKMMRSKHNILHNPPVSPDQYYQPKTKKSRRKRKVSVLREQRKLQHQQHQQHQQENPPFPDMSFGTQPNKNVLSRSTQRIGHEERKLTALQREYELIQQQIQSLEEDKKVSNEFTIINKKNPQNNQKEDVYSLLNIQKNNFVMEDNLMDEPTQKNNEKTPQRTHHIQQHPSSLSPQVIQKMNELTKKPNSTTTTTSSSFSSPPQQQQQHQQRDEKRDLEWERRIFEVEKKLFESEKERKKIHLEFNNYRKKVNEELSFLKNEVYQLKQIQEKSRFLKSTDHVGEVSILKGGGRSSNNNNNILLSSTPTTSRKKKSSDRRTPKPSIEYDTRGSYNSSSSEKVIIDDIDHDDDYSSSQQQTSDDDDDDEQPQPYNILPQPQPIVLGPESGKNQKMNYSKRSESTMIVGRKLRNKRDITVI